MAYQSHFLGLFHKKQTFPPVPMEPPPYLSHHLRLRRDVWRRVARTVQVLARTGVSLQMELANLLAFWWGIQQNAGSLKRLLRVTLPSTGLVQKEVLQLIGHSRVALLRLTPRGEALSRVLGVEPVESEWARLLRLHQGARQPRHTAAVLTFAYYARWRGWRVSLLPDVAHSSEPDVLIEQCTRRFYVEVELGHARLDKWRRQEDLQGFAALCALTLSRRRR